MASPHAAGAAALLVAANGDWSPAEIQSALMTTGSTDVLTEDGVTPATWFDQGSGRIQVDMATQAGLVLDIANADFTAADLECSWTRTVKATADGSWTVTATADRLDLTVTPATFTLAEGATQELTITADVSNSTSDVWLFGDVTLSATGVPDTLLPVAVTASTGDLPASVEIATRRNAGSELVTDLTAIEITQLTVETAGLAIGTQVELALPAVSMA